MIFLKGLQEEVKKECSLIREERERQSSQKLRRSEEVYDEDLNFIKTAIGPD